jgi:hypothetical protein
MEKDFATMMGKQVLTGNAGSENEAYTWFNTAEHAKLNANGVPLDHENVVLWIAGAIPSNTPAGKWWAHRLETIAAVPGQPAVAAVAAVVGPPAIAAVPAQPAVPAIPQGGYRTFQEFKTGFFEHFKMEKLGTIARRAWTPLKCDNINGVSTFTVRFNQLLPDVFPTLMGTAAGDLAAQQFYLERLPRELFTEISKRGDFASLAECQDATIQMARTLLTAAKMHNLNIGDGAAGGGRGNVPRGRGPKGGGKGAGKRTAAESQTTDTGAPPYPCKTCGEMHFHSACPVRIAKKKKAAADAATAANGGGRGAQTARGGKGGRGGGRGGGAGRGAGAATPKDRTAAPGSKQEAWSKGLCFICRGSGHLAKDCPQKMDE